MTYRPAIRQSLTSEASSLYAVSNGAKVAVSVKKVKMFAEGQGLRYPQAIQIILDSDDLAGPFEMNLEMY